jgi:hypothetical protein
MIKSPLLLFLFLIGFTLSIHAQQFSIVDTKVLQTKEDSLKSLAVNILQAESYEDRASADSLFTRILVRSLKTKNSFQYPFDSLVSISRMYPADSSFRIFTWQLMISENKFKHHGAIQIKTADGTLQLFPLIDKSEEMKIIEDTITSNLAWVGAIYYRIIQKEFEKKKCYTLIGYDELGTESSRKIMDVLQFVDGKPQFGGNFFILPNDSIKPRNPLRFVMEYKKGAGPKLNYDEELDLIVKENLVSQTKEPNKKSTLIGDGDYDGMKWYKGKWVFVNKIFKEVTPEGNAPIPMPIKDNPETGKNKAKKKSNNK